MFVGMLNEEQRRALFVLAHRLVNADGIVVRAELRALGALRNELDSVDHGFDPRDESELADLFDSRPARVVALLELLALARSDHDYCLDEESMITTVAHEMRVDFTDLERLDAWVQEHLLHIEEALALMAG